VQPGRVDAAVVADEAGHGQRGQGLSAARLAHDADRLAAVDVEAHPAHGAHRTGRPGEAHLEVAHAEHDVVGRVGEVRRGRTGIGRGPAARHRQPAAAHLDTQTFDAQPLDPQPLGDRLADQVERQAGQQHGRAGGERRGRVQVEGARAVVEQPAPVEGRRLDPESEERQAREGQQRAAGADGGVHDQRLGDVRQHVADQDPSPADPGHPRGRHVVAGGDPAHQRVHQPGERRGAGEPDGHHRPRRPDAEHDGEEQRQQHPGEGHGDVDRGRHQPPHPAAEHERRRPEQQPDDDRDRHGQQGEHDRQPGRDERAGEDVAAEVVGARPVRRRRLGQDVRGVDGLGVGGPEHRPEHGQRGDHQQQGEGHQAER
jgi:hypothetical protein